MSQSPFVLQNVGPPRTEQVTLSDYKHVLSTALGLPAHLIGHIDFVAIHAQLLCHPDAIPLISNAMAKGVFRTGVFASFTERHHDHQVTAYTSIEPEPRNLIGTTLQTLLHPLSPLLLHSYHIRSWDIGIL
eukprot:CAMPEP_0184738804 /NCGR_PEP_ID=MMETSP0315-20130426/1506_1 /TAXON_ID=101924 /ORGANISM="Rhodosorus marinus, Strain UTEX LB 2760" /LENGTH=130 /DNA_ID=CAMNT_0027206865 /DNA_START=1288 /DNA_END=1680 /DNA_ORIENTATION=+